MDVVVYSEIWDRIRGSFDVDDLICVTGRVRYDEFSKRLGVTADEVWNLMKLRKNVAQYLSIQVDESNLESMKTAKEISDDLRIYQKMPVRLSFRKKGAYEGALFAEMKISVELVDLFRKLNFKPYFIY